MLLKSKIRRFFLGPERGFPGKTESPYFNGIRTITIGGLVAFLGGAIVAFGMEDFGIAVLIAGISIGVIGLFYHVILMVVSLFKRRSESGQSKSSE